MGEITIPSDTAYDQARHLSYADIAVDRVSSPTLLTLPRCHLKQSKTDQFHQGIDIYVGRTNNQLCPAAATMAYLAARGASPGPLFIFKDGRLLSRDRFVDQVTQAIGALGLNSQNYAGHSFRIGAATTAAECRVEDSVIKALGRWKSSAFQVYIRTPRDRLASISQLLSSHS